MDKLKKYLDSLKTWSPDTDFVAAYSNVVVRQRPNYLFGPAVLRVSAVFAVLFVVLSAGIYYSNFRELSDNPLSYVFEQESMSGNGPIGYIFAE